MRDMNELLEELHRLQIPKYGAVETGADTQFFCK